MVDGKINNNNNKRRYYEQVALFFAVYKFPYYFLEFVNYLIRLISYVYINH